MEHVRIRMQLQGQYKTAKYSGSFDAAKKIFKKHGTKGLFNGFTATLARETAFCFNFFLFYEEFKRMYGVGPEYDLNFLQVFIGGGITGILTWGIIYPIDSLKSIAQAEPLNQSKKNYKGYIDLVRTYTAKKGIKPLYNGLNVCMLRSFPVNAITFSCYEVADDLIDRFHKHNHDRESLDYLI